MMRKYSFNYKIKKHEGHYLYIKNKHPCIEHVRIMIVHNKHEKIAEMDQV
jgi:hypothetical protein